MPLQVINADSAFKSLEQAPCIWPAGWDDPRLEPLVSPSFKPSFSIRSDDKIFCMGSCFARNIEE